MNFNINMEISNNCWGGWNIRNCDKLLGEMASQMEKGIRVEKIGLDGYKEKRIIKEYSNDKYCFISMWILFMPEIFSFDRQVPIQRT